MTRLGTFYRGQWSAVAIATVCLLVFSFALGGASRQHELRLALVELAALPLLVLGLQALVANNMVREHSFALGITAAIIAVPLVQLIPLPPSIWSSLPGRSELVLALQLIGTPPGWVPLSLTPDRTWASALALLPPVAMLVGMFSAKAQDRTQYIWLLLGAIAVAAALAAVQFASGSDRFYFWRSTDSGSVVGMFANRNHLATLCLAAIPFAAVFGGRAIKRGGSRDRVILWLSGLFIATLVVMLAVIRSRAGVVLVGPVLIASLVAMWVAAGRGRPGVKMLAIVGGVAVAFAVVGVFALSPILARFDTSAAREGRFENWPIVAEAANQYLPVGSGVGSFDSVFRSVEPLEQLDATYFNQAHNDYLELWLETGWIGAAILIAFFVWYTRRSWAAWRAQASGDRNLQRAATIAIGAVLAHSAIDYPIRTATIATLFALFCGILEFAGQADEASASRKRRVAR